MKTFTLPSTLNQGKVFHFMKKGQSILIEIPKEVVQIKVVIEKISHKKEADDDIVYAKPGLCFFEETDK